MLDSMKGPISNFLTIGMAKRETDKKKLILRNGIDLTTNGGE